MQHIKILNLEDKEIFPEYSKLFGKILDEVSDFYLSGEMMYRPHLFTPEKIYFDIEKGYPRRYIGHFNDNKYLDGLLIELEEGLENQRMISWVMVDTKGKGIGTKLIKNTLELAKKDKKDSVMLTVYSKNERAIKLYERLGFIHRRNIDEYNLRIMGYLLKE